MQRLIAVNQIIYAYRNVLRMAIWDLKGNSYDVFGQMKEDSLFLKNGNTLIYLELKKINNFFKKLQKYMIFLKLIIEFTQKIIL